MASTARPAFLTSFDELAISLFIVAAGAFLIDVTGLVLTADLGLRRRAEWRT